VLSKKDVVGCDGRTLPDTLRAGIQRTTIDNVGDFSKEGSPLLLCEGLVFACNTESLSDRLDK